MSSTNTQKIMKLEPPDGGWGWMVVLGTALNNAFNMSMITLFSLVYGDAIEDMGYKTQGAALVLGTLLFCSNFGGPLAGVLVKLTSPRIVAIMGSCLCTVGIFLSGLSTNIWHLVITYGIMCGLGLDFISNSTFVTINSYFKLKKSRAVGLAYVGTCLGQISMPHVVRYLLDEFGFRGACLVLSSLSFHGVAGTLLLQPVERHMKETAVEVPVDKLQQNKCKEIRKNAVFKNEAQKVGNKQNENMQISELRLPTENLKHKKLKNRQENKTSNTKHVNGEIINKPEITSPHTTAIINPIAEIKASLSKKFYDLLGISLLTNFRFASIIIGLALITTSVSNFSLIFPFFLQKMASMDKQQTAYCMSAIAAADMMGRLIMPIFQDIYKVPARWILVMSCTWLIIVRQILAYQTGMGLLLFTSILYGCGRSMTIVCKNLAISENCKLEQVPAAVGLGMFTMGIISPPAGYFLGWIRDYTDSYIACITAQNAVLVLLLVMWVPDLLYLHIKDRKERKKNPETIS